MNALKKGIAKFILGDAAEPKESMIGGKLVLDSIEQYKKMNAKAVERQKTIDEKIMTSYNSVN